MKGEAVVVMTGVEASHGDALIEELKKIHLCPTTDAQQIRDAVIESRVKVPKCLQASLVESRISNAVYLAGSPAPSI